MVNKTPTIKEIRDRIVSDINARIPSSDARLPNSVLNILATVFAMAIYPLYQLFEYICLQIDPATAEGTYLERHGRMVRLTRNSASPGVGRVTFTGLAGTEIPLGTEIQRSDGVKYQTTVAAQLTADSITVPVISLDDGKTVNADQGVQCSLISPIAGLDSECEIASGGITGGSDIESDKDFKERILERMKNPPGAGTKADYKNWAESIPGVSKAWVYPQELGVGNVTVRIITDQGSEAPIPSEELIKKVKDYIETVRPIGVSNLQVLAPIAKPLDLTIDLLPDDETTRESVKSSLKNLIRQEAEPGGTLLLSHIRQAISNATGEYDNALVSPTADVTSETGELLVLGEITWQ